MKPYILLTIGLLAFINLHGRETDTITVGVRSAPPFLMKENNQWTGASVDLWESIADELEISYKYKEYSLNEMLQALENNELDVSISPLTVTADRIEAFQFTQPFYITTLTIATQKESDSYTGAFLRNFLSPDFFKALTGLLVLIFIFGFILWIAEKRKNPQMFQKGWKGIWDGFWWSAVTMTTVGYGDKAPVTPMGKIFGLIWMFTAIIVISGFTASIASSLTVSRMGSAIEKMNDLRNVSVGTVKASSTAEFLQNQNINFSQYDNIDQAIDALYHGEYKALVYDDAILTYTIHHKKMNDELGVLPLKFNKQYYSFAMPYENQLNNPINVKLIQFIESPKWRQVQEKYNMEVH